LSPRPTTIGFPCEYASTLPVVALDCQSSRQNGNEDKQAGFLRVNQILPQEYKNAGAGFGTRVLLDDSLEA
jgi:hypothetical protein